MSIVWAKDWWLHIFYEVEGDDVPVPNADDLAQVKLPFNITPEQTASIPDEYTTGIQHYVNTTDADSVPWTSYYATYRRVHLAVSNAFGIWFEIEKTTKGWRAIRVVRPSVSIKHWPVKGIDFQHLEDTRDTIWPPPVEPRKKSSVFCKRPDIDNMDTESKVKEDNNMKPTRSSQTEQGRGGNGRPLRGPGGNPFSSWLHQNNDIKPKWLEGTPPKQYKGDRNRTYKFLQDFKRFMKMNIDADIAKNPFKKSTYFLSLIDGLDTEGWTDEMDNWLDKVEDNHSEIPTGMNKWQYIEQQFKKSFVDYTEHEKANKELAELRMKDRNVDHYIARFQQLAHRGGHNLDQPLVMTKFAQGLLTHLSDSCFKMHDPDTFEEWTQSAQWNYCIWMKKQEAKGNLTAIQNWSERPGNPWAWLQWRDQGRGGQTHGNPNRRNPWNPTHYTPSDPNAMDTSAATKKAVTEADKQKYRQEGQCYKCSKQGHLARNCPNKTPHIKATSSSEEKPEKAAVSKTENLTDRNILANYARELSDEARDTFIRKLMERGEGKEDFSTAWVLQLSLGPILQTQCT
jgi:Retrotransposon gag protein/Zinc knuckle